MKTKTASIFLVDDEQPVLDGLSVTLGKTFPELRICGTARSGMDALEGIAREKPDIIIMDVRMPGMNGIDTLREVRKILPDTVSILLTAYERFDMAQDAYALGVYRYLVKPVTQEDLTETITGALKKLGEIKNATLEEAARQERFEKTRPLLEAGFIWSVVSGGRSLILPFAESLERTENGEIRGHFAAFYKNGEPASGITEQFRFSPETETRRESFSPEELKAVRRELTNRLDCIPGSPWGGMLPVFVPGEKLNRSREIFRSALEALDMPELSFSLGFCASNEDLRISWSQAVSGIFREEPDRDNREEELFRFLKDGDMLKLRTTFLDWSAAGAGKTDRALMAGALLALTGADAGRVLAGGKLQLGVNAENREGAEYAADLLVTGLSSFSGEEQAGECALPDRRIRKALQFIAARYSEPISLEETAAHAELSPAHLSRLFSLETGSTFSSHLAHFRINRACRELSRGDRSIKEISGLCGYPDANYFSRAFKKAMGISPTEWAALQQGQEL